MGPTIEITKMKEFAKLFKHDEYGQILVVADRSEDEDGIWKPRITIRFMTPALGIAAIDCFFEDSENGYNKRNAGFKDMDVNAAAKVIEPVIEDLL